METILNKYSPNNNEIIFHYCNTSSFEAICKNKTIRLSDIFSMNDYQEIYWGYNIWEEVATILKPELGEDFIDKIDENIHNNGKYFLPIVASFSIESDSLSQWRGYADNGQGYCIGFNASELFELPIIPIKVIYNKEEQIKSTITDIKQIHKKILSIKNTEEADSALKEACITLLINLCSFKNPAFEEEKEIRIMDFLYFKESGKYAKLACNPNLKNKIDFRFKDNCPVAFLDYNYSLGDKKNPIKKILIGPKNESLPTGISLYLETIGIHDVEIYKSEASYR